MPGTDRRWHVAAQHAQRAFGDFFDPGLVVAKSAGDHHVWLQDDAFERDALRVELAENSGEHDGR